ncbi:hypothetical protein LZ30DRAFT_481598 [Colletotrichum cereale]|nr:hypothetical protein LZ30DRAFT_481598 [Colletotrichum cereale]
MPTYEYTLQPQPSEKRLSRWVHPHAVDSADTYHGHGQREYLHWQEYHITHGPFEGGFSVSCRVTFVPDGLDKTALQQHNTPAWIELPAPAPPHAHAHAHAPASCELHVSSSHISATLPNELAGLGAPVDTQGQPQVPQAVVTQPHTHTHTHTHASSSGPQGVPNLFPSVLVLFPCRALFVSRNRSLHAFLSRDIVQGGRENRVGLTRGGRPVQSATRSGSHKS